MEVQPMNEVSNNRVLGGSSPVAVNSSKGAETGGAQEAVKVSKSAVSVSDEKPAKPLTSHKKLEAAVAQINELVQNEQRDLSFSIDEKSGVTIVKVFNRESGELVRQIPNEVVLDLAESVSKDEPVHLINVYG
jgi:flagellar protein FlaG